MTAISMQYKQIDTTVQWNQYKKEAGLIIQVSERPKHWRLYDVI